MQVLAPGVNRYFTKTEKDVLNLARTVETTQEDGTKSELPTSKKDDAVRRKEHLQHISPVLRRALVESPDSLRALLLDTSLLGVVRELCRCAPGSKLATAIATQALGEEGGEDIEGDVSR